jgi:hypothetical protein
VLVGDHESDSGQAALAQDGQEAAPEQNTSSSLSPTSMPRISRLPLAATSVAITTAIEVT